MSGRLIRLVPSPYAPHMDEFTAEDRRDARFQELLSEGHPDDRLYVYWLQNGRRITPAIIKSRLPFEDLHEFLQADYGAQWYCAMIRRGKKMILRHEFGIAQPLHMIPRKDIRVEIEYLRRRERWKSP